MTISYKEVPEAIRTWVKETLGVDIREYKLHPNTDVVNVDSPISEHAREYWKGFRIGPDGVVFPSDRTLTRSGWEISDEPNVNIKLEPGTLVVNAVRDYKYNAAYIYTAIGGLDLLPSHEGDVELTDEEWIALMEAKQLKSFARTKFKEDVYAELIAKGYMRRNKSLTLQGTNLLEDVGSRDARKAAIERMQAKYGPFTFQLSVR